MNENHEKKIEDRKSSYSAQLTNSTDLDNLETLIKAQDWDLNERAIARKLFSKLLREERQRFELGTDSGNEEQRKAQVPEDADGTQANAAKLRQDELIELQIRLECEIEKEGYGPNYITKLCELLYKIGREYPDLCKIMNMAETEIIASNISPP